MFSFARCGTTVSDVAVLKRITTLLALILALLVAGVLVLRSTAPNDCITRENLKRIEYGMTKAQVQFVLGGPGTPSDPTDCPEVYRGMLSEALTWEGERGNITVFLNRDSKVSAMATTLPDNEHLLDKLRRRLGF
jgi:hypothetical protein